MYPNPNNVIGLEPPVFGEVHPEVVIKAAWDKYARLWHPDRWIRTDSPTKRQRTKHTWLGKKLTIAATLQPDSGQDDPSLIGETESEEED
jgi:hypothetical protein